MSKQRGKPNAKTIWPVVVSGHRARAKAVYVNIDLGRLT